MSIILFGSNGQLGREINEHFKSFNNFHAFNSNKINFLHAGEITEQIEKIKPEIIINSAAFTDVNNAELNKESAYRINAEAVEEIALSAKKNNTKLIHFSTDYVFNGKKESPYNENDTPDPLNIYGSSKLEGEKLIFESGCNFFIFRISWLISKHNNNFLTKVISQLMSKEEIQIVNDQFGATTSTEFVAKVIYDLIVSKYNLKSGIYHLSNSGKASWYEIALYIFNQLREVSPKINKKHINILPVSSSSIYNQAIRPKNSSLDCSKLEKALMYSFPHWKTEIKKIINTMYE